MFFYGRPLFTLPIRAQTPGCSHILALIGFAVIGGIAATAFKSIDNART